MIFVPSLCTFKCMTLKIYVSSNLNIFISAYQYDVSEQIQLHIQGWFLRRSFLNYFSIAAYVKYLLDHQDWNPISIVDPKSTFCYLICTSIFILHIFHKQDVPIFQHRQVYLIQHYESSPNNTV